MAHVAHLGLAAACAVLVLSVTTLVMVPHYSRPIGAADVGTAAPDFALRDSAGKTVALADQRGKAVVLCFASPDERLARLAREYESDARVAFLAVIRTEAGLVASPAVAPVHTLLDDRGAVTDRYSAAAALAAVVNSPLVLVIDARGMVHYRGPFEDNADPVFVTRQFCSDALREVLDAAPTATVASLPSLRK